MTNSLGAVALFIGIVSVIGVFFGKMGNLSFWKLAAQLPDQAFEWWTSDPTWVVLENSAPAPGEDFVGPFLFTVPTLGRTLKLYARQDQIEQSQQRFVQKYASLLPPRRFPILSSLALFYPIGAMLSMSNTPASSFLILGYGFANLGYLLGVAFVVPGHFRVLGLDHRLPTVVVAVIFWIIGFALGNVALGVASRNE